MNIEVKGVSKKFGGVSALDGLSCTFEFGKIYGLLGRNGAGKTTLLNIMTNKVIPSEGVVLIQGQDVLQRQDILRQVYYMTEQPLFPGGMRVKKLLYWTKHFYKNFSWDYAVRLVNDFGLQPNRKVKELSTGYGTILKAILTLASNAPLMFFDEPILGLDAFHRDLLYKEILKNYSQEPKTMILSTHLIDEVADILEEVLIIKEGRLLVNEPVEDILASSYMVSGSTKDVDQYLKGKKWIGEKAIQNFKSVIFFNEERDEGLAKSLGLQFSQPELQSIFICLTSS